MADDVIKNAAKVGGAKRGRPLKAAPVQSAPTKPAPAKPAASKAGPLPKSAIAKPAVTKPEIKKPAVVKVPAVKVDKPVLPVAAEAKASSAIPIPPSVTAAVDPAPLAPPAAAPEASAPVVPPVEASAPAAKPIPAKPVMAKPALKVTAIADTPVPPAALMETAKGAAIKTGSAIEKTFAGFFPSFTLEDKTMEMNTNFSGFQDAVSEAQAKAKAAFEKGTSTLGEVTEFAKGNVEAMVESGKIFAEGVQGMGSEIVAESRSAFETMTADIKELAAVKSPTDFFKIQGELMRKNFDSAVAYSSKNSEAMLKLVSDAVAPISGRVSIAMEKARSTSL
ncbi:phasin [Novosphingobium sp. Rr 2-17]|nr:phasin [Novosphingobium sp. Rr 2-17]